MFAVAAARIIVLSALIAVFTPLECYGQLSIKLNNSIMEILFDSSDVRTISLAPGGYYIIYCTIMGNSEFSESPWTKDSEPVVREMTHPTPSSNPTVYYFGDDLSSHRELHILNFDNSLSGSYTCSSNKDVKTLIISSSNPSIILNEALREIDEGHNIALVVSAYSFGNPVPTLSESDYRWFFNGGSLPTDLEISQSSPGLFQFYLSSAATLLYNGVYTLVVNTTAGTANDSFTILVTTFPIITFEASCSDCLDDSDVLRIPENSTFSLSCVETHSNPRPEFTWFKDGEDDPLHVLEFDQTITQEAVFVNESKIMFHQIPRDDAGTYGCKANNTKFKDFKEVTIIVEFAPIVTFLSPSTIDVPVGDDLNILVLFEGGSPAPSFNWTYMNGLDPITTQLMTSDDSRIILSGSYSGNLTLTNVTMDNGGIYTLTATNTLGSITLEFTVNVQFPPTLNRRSEVTVHSAIGKMAVFKVDVVTPANPPVTIGNLQWTGNFDSSRASETFINNVTVLRLQDVVMSDTGSITLTVNHPAKVLTITFELIVLNLPSVPGSIEVTSTSGSCDVTVEWKIPDPAPFIAPTDNVLVEYRACADDDTACVLPWQLWNTYPSTVSSSTVSLLVNSQYTFRLTGCSDDYGCGPPVVVSSTVETSIKGDFQPIVNNLNLQSSNSSSITVHWSSPTLQSDCYDVFGYMIVCHEDSRRNELAYSKNVSKRGETDSYTLVLNNLEPDSRYNCSAAILYTDSNGGVYQLDVPPTYASSYTLPQLSLLREFKLTVGTTPLILNLSTIDTSFNLEEVSLIHIVVVRLGNNPTLPPQSPDAQYQSVSDFSTYSEVHSQDDKISYKPYIAAEFEPDNIPRTFEIGSGEIEDSRKREQQYVNGALALSSYYTFFARVYAKSRFNSQTSVFISSSYTEPYEISDPEPSNDGTSGSNSSTVAAVVAVLVIVIAAVSGANIVIAIVFYWRYKRGKRQTIPLDDDNGHAMNEYSNMDEVKGESLSPPPPTSDAPPQLPSSAPPKKRPIMATNAMFDSEEQDSSTSAMDHDEKRSLSIALDCSSTPSSVSPTPRHASPISLSSVGEKRKWSQPVDRDMFQAHLDRLDENDQRLFEKEFLHIQSYSTEYPAEASTRACMHGKNRYKNVTAFDHTRVALSKNPDDPNSDYINANYIKGYDEHKLYIATQGPTEETHIDFWRMIWEQRTTTIIMLTNLEEKGKPKCYKYWPSHGGKAYGNIIVRKDRDIVLPFYVIRSFKLIDVNDTIPEGGRTVIQFHYTSWPDKNVPAQAAPLLDFLRAINIANDAAKHGPMVVHCSAGVGRTGTIIALDICLDQLKTEGQVDVGSVVSFLREQRTQMVQTMSQYIFIHHAMLEDIVYGDSTVMLKTFPEKYLKLQASHCALIKDEFDRIGLVKPPAQANSNPLIVCTETADKDGRDDAFTGFIVDGYWYHHLFIACSMSPTPENQELFWQLIWREGCSHVINISQKTHGLFVYLPDTGSSQKFKEFEVTVKKMDYKTGYILRHITIANEEASISIKHMQYEDWLGKQMPKTEKLVRFLLEVIHETHSKEREGHPVLVHDNGSMSQVGTFVTLLNCCERIKKERLVDLLQTVNRLHLQCPRAVTSMELNHYAYCYDCIREYCEKLQRETSEPPIYENIASIRGRLQPSPEPIQSDTIKYLNDYEILDESILGSIAEKNSAV